MGDSDVYTVHHMVSVGFTTSHKKLLLTMLYFGDPKLELKGIKRWLCNLQMKLLFSHSLCCCSNRVWRRAARLTRQVFALET